MNTNKQDLANDLIVRRFQPADLEQVTILLDSYRMFYGRGSDLALSAAYLEQRAGDSTIILVAVLTCRDAVIGFCNLFPSLSTVRAGPIFVLNDLFVHESSRRLGAGQALLRAAEAEARRASVAAIVLETSKSNFHAQALYRRMEWVPQENILFELCLELPTELSKTNGV